MTTIRWKGHYKIIDTEVKTQYSCSKTGEPDLLDVYNQNVETKVKEAEGPRKKQPIFWVLPSKVNQDPGNDRTPLRALQLQ